MKDILQDIVAHTHALGFLNLLKITGSSNSTNLTAVTDTKSVLLYGETHQTIPEFEGTFGMGSLEKLNLHLKNPEYQEDAEITVIREKDEDIEYPSYIHFKNVLGDFQNNYRFINHKIVDNQVKSYRFKGANWDVDFDIPIASISRMKLMSAVHSEESIFNVRTEKDNLVFSFGDANDHAGEFIFKHKVGGSLKNTRSYPISEVQAILTLAGDKTMQISSEQGAMKITVDSGLATYDYIVPIATK